MTNTIETGNEMVKTLLTGLGIIALVIIISLIISPFI